MTTNELHDILDDENRTLTINELKQVVYELKQDCIKESAIHLDKNSLSNYHFYTGEANAFMICLDLLEHLESNI